MSTPLRPLWKGKCLVQDHRVREPEEETANPRDSSGPDSLLQPRSCATDASGLGSPTCGHLTVEFTGPFSLTVCCRGDRKPLLPPLPLRKARKAGHGIISLYPHAPQQRNSGAWEGGTKEGIPHSKTTRRSLGGQGQEVRRCSAIPASCLPLLKPQLPEGGQGLPEAAPKRTFPSWERGPLPPPRALN